MAKTTNLGDPYNHRLTLRLTDKQMNFLKDLSDIMGVSPSEYLRMTINTAAVSMSQKIEMMKKGEVGMHEDVKTDNNDKL